MLRSFWIFAFSSSSFKICRFTYQRPEVASTKTIGLNKKGGDRGQSTFASRSYNIGGGGPSEPQGVAFRELGR